MILSELTNATGAAFFVFLFILRAGQAAEGNWIAILLALQSAAAAFLLVMHKPVERMSHPVMTLLSWLCALLPLTFNLEDADALYSLPGLLLALWALFALGFSFSIAPEDRGVVMRGPYRLVRHPMYLGELLLRLALLASVDALFAEKAILLAVMADIQVARILREERIISGYTKYSRQVRWRLLPGVF